MRIPRVAFALMAIAIGVLSLKIATVHATGAGRWFVMRIRDGNGKEEAKVISNEFGPDGKRSKPVITFPVTRGTVGVSPIVLGGNAESISVGVRAVYFPPDSDKNKQQDQVLNAPMKEVACPPGQKVPLFVEGYGRIEISVEMQDSRPATNLSQFPPKGSLSLKGYLALLNGDKVVGKTEFESGQTAAADGYFALRIPADGRYIFAAKVFDGAVEGQLNFNQIRFKLDGQDYLMIAGAPVSSANQSMWVRHDPEAELPENKGMKQTVEFGLLSNLAKKQ
ncbi:MAG TPA: hypothetical protein VKZ53_27535 [Candidatus Angelobacter sp.]|nr:hypothetical protein [Candidatus Angelobacter sp.]